jgi:Transglycosylase SLT domain
VTQADGKALPFTDAAQVEAYVFAPTGAQGPILLASNNFDAILHYNQSRRYALAVSLLINRLKGQPALQTAWPTDDPGLSRARIKRLQEILLARHYDIGAADGIPGGQNSRGGEGSAGLLRLGAGWQGRFANFPGA